MRDHVRIATIITVAGVAGEAATCKIASQEQHAQPNGQTSLAGVVHAAYVTPASSPDAWKRGYTPRGCMLVDLNPNPLPVHRREPTPLRPKRVLIHLPPFDAFSGCLERGHLEHAPFARSQALDPLHGGRVRALCGRCAGGQLAAGHS